MNLIAKIIFLTFISTKLFCHPHTFIEVESTVNITNEEIKDFNIKWSLDEMTSMMLIMELDVDGNGKFDKKENNYIYENYFSSLQEQNFYMKLYTNKKSLKIKPKNFEASIKENRLIYSFNINNKVNIKDLKVEFFDEDLFVGMILKKEAIKLLGLENTKSEKLKKSIFGVE